jgi:hypothetical protein
MRTNTPGSEVSAYNEALENFVSRDEGELAVEPQ